MLYVLHHSICVLNKEEPFLIVRSLRSLWGELFERPPLIYHTNRRTFIVKYSVRQNVAKWGRTYFGGAIWSKVKCYTDGIIWNIHIE